MFKCTLWYAPSGALPRWYYNILCWIKVTIKFWNPKLRLSKLFRWVIKIEVCFRHASRDFIVHTLLKNFNHSLWRKCTHQNIASFWLWSEMFSLWKVEWNILYCILSNKCNHVQKRCIPTDICWPKNIVIGRARTSHMLFSESLSRHKYTSD